MPTIPVLIEEMPVLPSESDPLNFSFQADAVLSGLNNRITAINNIGDNIYNNGLNLSIGDMPSYGSLTKSNSTLWTGSQSGVVSTGYYNPNNRLREGAHIFISGDDDLGISVFAYGKITSWNSSTRSITIDVINSSPPSSGVISTAAGYWKWHTAPPPALNNPGRFKETAPSFSNSQGNKGDVAISSDWVYICIATNTWKRFALGSLT